MPNVAAVLKEEILRLARKQIREDVGPLRKQVADQRREIAELKRRLMGLERAQARAEKRAASGKSAAAVAPGDATPVPRFSPKWVKSDRDRLGLSAKDYGRLVGVSMLTIYNWEKGDTRPRDSALQRWGEVRKLGKREALRRLDELDGEED